MNAQHVTDRLATTARFALSTGTPVTVRGGYALNRRELPPHNPGVMARRERVASLPQVSAPAAPRADKQRRPANLVSARAERYRKRREQAEGWLLFLLATCGALGVLDNSVTAARLVNEWHAFVRLVASWLA